MISEESLSQFDSALVTGVLAGVVGVTGLTPMAAITLVFTVDTDVREYHETSSRPLASAVRSAGMKLRPPPCGWSRTTGLDCTGCSVPRRKLCSRTSPNGWRLASFQT